MIYPLKDQLFIVVSIMLIPVLFLFGCRNSESTVLPEDQMVNVATDIHLVEAGIKYVRRTEPIDDAQVYEAFDSIFRKNHTTKEQYELSMNYYQAHPEKLDKIYSEVITRLSTMQNSEKPGKPGK